MDLSPVGYWPLNDYFVDAAVAQDWSGNGEDGAVGSVMQANGSQLGGDGERYRIIQNQSTLDTGKILIPNTGGRYSSAATGSPISVAFLFWPASVNNNFNGLLAGTSGDWTAMHFQGRPIFGTVKPNGDTLRRRISDSNEITAAQWNLYTATLAGGDLIPDLDINDGGITTSTTNNLGFYSYASTHIRIGGGAGGYNAGSPSAMAHVAIFDKVLSGAEITGLHTAMTTDGW